VHTLATAADDGPVDACAASLQHIEFLNRKRDQLKGLQLEAEEQYLFALARLFNAGKIGILDLADHYEQYRHIAVTGHATRWNAHMPVGGNQLRYAAMFVPNGQDADSWQGDYPLPTGAPRPRGGVPVVYLLYDPDNVPCYVGSTAQFVDRMRSHQNSGKRFSRWQAHQCADRAAAFTLERQWLALFKPYLNKSS
jgi:hypothetical protein